MCISAMLALGLLAGCGGGGDDTTGSSDDFTAQADAICKSVNDQVDALDQPQSESDLAGYIDSIVPISADGIDQLKGLTPPDGQEDAVNEWIGTLEQQQDIAVDAQDLADSGAPSQQVIAKLGETDPLNEKGNQQAAALGLTTCAQDSGDGGSSGGSSS